MSNLECLNFTFDILCFTEVRETTTEILKSVFPEYEIYLNNPDTAKGGVALLLRKNELKNITEISPTTGFNLKGVCNCFQCKTENK